MDRLRAPSSASASPSGSLGCPLPPTQQIAALTDYPPPTLSASIGPLLGFWGKPLQIRVEFGIYAHEGFVRFSLLLAYRRKVSFESKLLISSSIFCSIRLSIMVILDVRPKQRSTLAEHMQVDDWVQNKKFQDIQKVRTPFR